MTLLVLWTLIFLLYLVIVFYIPYKKKLDTDILDAKQEYFDNKDKLDQIYTDQLKRKWEEDMIIRNKYFIIMFIVWCYVPIPFYAIYLLYPTTNQFTLDRYVPIAGGSLVLTTIITVLLWAGYTFGFFQTAYIIAIAIIGLLFAGIYIAVLMHATMFQRCVYTIFLYTAMLVGGYFAYGGWTMICVGVLTVMMLFGGLGVLMITSVLKASSVAQILFMLAVCGAVIVWGAYTFGIVVAVYTLILYIIAVTPVII